MLERSNIEGRDATSIAEDLTKAFDRFCAPTSSVQPIDASLYVNAIGRGHIPITGFSVTGNLKILICAWRCRINEISRG
jgi:hypothetical protein